MKYQEKILLSVHNNNELQECKTDHVKGRVPVGGVVNEEVKEE
jgi:hypothetical protein